MTTDTTTSPSTAHSPETTLFADAVDVPMWLDEDDATPFNERVRRDRDIAQRVQADEPVTRVRGWWLHMTRAAGPGAGDRLARSRQLVTLAMAGLGTLTGIGVALAAFHYEGTHPVNVVRLVALLLVLPKLLLI